MDEAFDGSRKFPAWLTLSWAWEQAMDEPEAVKAAIAGNLVQHYIPATIAIVLGLVALSQMKKNPEHFGGQPFAWTGIITGGLMLLIYGGIMIFYVIMIAIAASAK